MVVPPVSIATGRFSDSEVLFGGLQIRQIRNVDSPDSRKHSEHPFDSEKRAVLVIDL
jgi:hypothetical protein